MNGYNWVAGFRITPQRGLHFRSALRAHRSTIAVLSVALLQGLLYLAVVPPWQHYDEPTHFEYAWLIANRGTLPQRGAADQTMRREVAASMLTHQFYWNMDAPELLRDAGEINLGVSELSHPPTYYGLVSIPLRAARYLDVTSQLYVARAVSVALFVATIGAALGVMCELVSAGHRLRWAVPLALALLPPFADIMTAVNNDVGGIFLFSLFLWLAVRTIRYGNTWKRGLLLLATAAVAAITKNTAAVALLLTPMVGALALWRARRWNWQSLVAVGLVGILALFAATLEWGNARTWYRETPDHVQTTLTRSEKPGAPLGTAVLELDTTSTTAPDSLTNPVLKPQLESVIGQAVTLGGWVWASEPITTAQLNLDYSIADHPIQVQSTRPLTLTSTPTFVAWSTTVPSDAVTLRYRLSAGKPDQSRTVRVYLDGAVLTPGLFSMSTAPTFDDRSAIHGNWGGRPFTNLLRNGSGETTWPRFRPWIDQTMGGYTRQTPTLVLTALLDVQRTGTTLFREVPSVALFSFFGSFGWGHITVNPTVGFPVFVIIVIGALLGGAAWLAYGFRKTAIGVQLSLAFLAVAGILVWGNLVLRVLPLLDGVEAVAVARYGFPAVLPIMLVIVGGWRGLFPRRLQDRGALLILLLIAALDLGALWTIRSFYRALPL